MLFNSQLFLLVFLPLVAGAFWLLASFERQTNLHLKLLLLFASWVFYAYWDIRIFPLLLFSILVNYIFIRLVTGDRARGRMWLALGIFVNLGLLAYFKYANFFSEVMFDLFGTQVGRYDIVLPLAISFFTFQQISCLVDEHRSAKKPHGLLDHALYVSFFPQLIAGPIVRHHELIPQIRNMPARTGMADKTERGLMLIFIGLMKKVLLADTLASIANPVFDASVTGAVATFEAWAAMLAFALQIYFDFSGYSDMAIGMALLFGITLPINFNSPYKAGSLVEFWRRWHITLSLFLRDYLYIPLGGSRNGVLVMILALAATMVLGGLWHGAAWTFIIWGAVHGAGLGVNHLWAAAGFVLPRYTGWALTFLFAVVTFTIFRAENLTSFWHITSAAVGLGGEQGKAFAFNTTQYSVLFAGLMTALFLPSSTEFVSEKTWTKWWRQNNVAIGAAVAAVAIVIYLGRQADQEFIYFQF